MIADSQESPRYLTTTEIAKMYRVEPKTINWWIRSGKLKALRLGTHYRITQADWDDFWARSNSK